MFVIQVDEISAFCDWNGWSFFSFSFWAEGSIYALAIRISFYMPTLPTCYSLELILGAGISCHCVRGRAFILRSHIVLADEGVLWYGLPRSHAARGLGT